jgi:hypothetical protein
MSPQPELDQIDLPTSNLKVLSPLHKHKKYDLHSYNSHLNIMHRRVENRPIQHSRLSLKFSNPHHWKRCFSPQVLRQRKDAYFASFRLATANDSMTPYRRRSDVSGVRMSPSADGYASLGTSFVNLFGTEQSPQAQDARTNPVATIHSWSQQRSSSPAPSEVAASPSPPSFMRDTALVRAAMQMSDLRLYVTSETAHDNDQPRNDNNPWRRFPSSPPTRHSSGGDPQPEHVGGDDVGYASNSRDIHFGLSPNAVFDRAENHGSYREFENRNDEGIHRGFEFTLDDANRGNNHSSATPSDCDDDYSSSNDEDKDHSSNGNSH